MLGRMRRGQAADGAENEISDETGGEVTHIDLF
jgi:hypothetical protein